MKKTFSAMCCLAAAVVCTTVNADVTNPFGATGYASTDKDWLTNTAQDIDGNGLGTDGWIFFGDFQPGNNGNNNPGNDLNSNIIGANANTTLFTVSAPSYVTDAATGSTSSNVGQFDYESIDNPLTLDGTDENAGNLLVTGTGLDALQFTISGLAANTTVRVGLLGAVLNDDARARFDAPEIGLTDGTFSDSVTGLPNLSDGTAGPSLGWVFFDIDLDGTYTVSVPPNPAGPDPDVTGFGGITFDSIVAVPEPSSAALLALGGLGMLIRRRR